jgi:hypothetical protein
MADDEDAEQPWLALSNRMTQIEELANEACKRLMAQVRRGLTMQGNEDCAWTRSDAGKIAYNHLVAALKRAGRHE